MSLLVFQSVYCCNGCTAVNCVCYLFCRTHFFAKVTKWTKKEGFFVQPFNSNGENDGAALPEEPENVFCLPAVGRQVTFGQDSECKKLGDYVLVNASVAFDDENDANVSEVTTEVAAAAPATKAKRKRRKNTEVAAVAAAAPTTATAATKAKRKNKKKTPQVAKTKADEKTQSKVGKKKDTKKRKATTKTSAQKRPKKTRKVKKDFDKATTSSGDSGALRGEDNVYTLEAVLNSYKMRKGRLLLTYDCSYMIAHI